MSMLWLTHLLKIHQILLWLQSSCGVEGLFVGVQSEERCVDVHLRDYVRSGERKEEHSNKEPPKNDGMWGRGREMSVTVSQIDS